MSNTSTSETTSLVCANCGGKEGSDVTNTCNKCKSVMYCNAACKKRHRHKHKKDCEEHVKRAAEQAAKEHDEKLFKQPPPFEDCPICMIRLPIIGSGRTYMVCCGKVICSGCIHAFRSRVTKKEHDVCPFCRTPPPSSNEVMIKRYEIRMKLSDEQAIYNFGGFHYEGTNGVPQNYAKALELWHKAGELGSTDAYFSSAYCYRNGRGVEIDEKKAIYYYELGTMKGNVLARFNLGCIEEVKGNMDRALKHWMIAVRDGEHVSLKKIKQCYIDGHATKDDYTKALRSYQAYLDEIKSDQRDQAAASDDHGRYYESYN